MKIYGNLLIVKCMNNSLFKLQDFTDWNLQLTYFWKMKYGPLSFYLWYYSSYMSFAHYLPHAMYHPYGSATQWLLQPACCKLDSVSGDALILLAVKYMFIEWPPCIIYKNLNISTLYKFMNTNGNSQAI